MRDDRTKNLNLPKPSLRNLQDEDVPRIAQALDMIDAEIWGAGVEVSGNATPAAGVKIHYYSARASPGYVPATPGSGAVVDGALQDEDGTPRDAAVQLDGNDEALEMALQLE
jgi:hypothetical protein